MDENKTIHSGRTREESCGSGVGGGGWWDGRMKVTEPVR